MSNQQTRREIIAWVGAQVLPHEADARAWLYRLGHVRHEVDDMVQEAYCRLAALSSVAHIANGRAYFFQTLRNIALENLRRARIVRLDLMTEIEVANIVDHEPGPERIIAGREELRRIEQIIAALPHRCREIFSLRRIQGFSQKEIARRLNVTENVVEMQMRRALQLILVALEEHGVSNPSPVRETRDDKRSNRKGDR